MKLIKLVKETILDICASVFYGMGISVFASQAEFAPGGISGVVLILNHIFNVPMGTVYLAVNLPLLFIAYRFVGKDFLIRTLRSIIVSTFFLDFVFTQIPKYRGSRLIAAIMSGICLGIALSVFYRSGTSSGGSDLICVTVNTVRPEFSLGKIGIVIDIVVILVGYPVFGNVDSVLLGIISGVITGLVVDRLASSYGSENIS